ncbi:MAG: hypothetical protein WCR49_10770 [Opitutae bacterium]
MALMLLVVALVLGLSFTLAGRVLQRRNCDQVVADLRDFAAIHADYFQQRQSWPPSTGEGLALPPPLADALKATNWSQRSPFGGSYGWVKPDPAGVRPGREWGGAGAVTLTAFAPSFPLTLTQADLRYIDRQLDDGNLATGRFRTGFNGWPIYLVEAVKP